MTIPATMKGVQLTSHGGPEKLTWNEEIPVPLPGPGEALVKVLAAGVNNTDINTRIGWYSKQVTGATADTAGVSETEPGGWAGALQFPRIQGGDLCGRVVALGDGVAKPEIGSRVTCATNQPSPSADNPFGVRVIGSEYDGAFAQYCKVPADQLFDVSASPLTDAEIAAIPCAHGTAFNLVKRSDIRNDDKVLVTGASGGVGMAVVQLAKLYGTHVTAMAGPAKHGAVYDAGADVVLDRNAVPPAGTFSVVVDVVGGPGWGALIDALRPGGRYAVSGAIAGPIVEADLRTIYLRDLTIFGCTFTSRDVFAELIGLVNEGRLKPLVSRTFPLEEISIAQADFGAKIYPGKIVLIPPSE